VAVVGLTLLASQGPCHRSPPGCRRLVLDLLGDLPLRLLSAGQKERRPYNGAARLIKK